MDNISNPIQLGRKFAGTKVKTGVMILLHLASAIFVLSRLDFVMDTYVILPLILCCFFFPALYLISLYGFISAHDGKPKYHKTSKPFIALSFLAGFGFFAWGLSPAGFQFTHWKSIVAIICGAIIVGAVFTINFWPDENASDEQFND